MQATASIERLLAFAQANGLIENEDIHFARNMLLAAMGLSAPEENAPLDPTPLPPTATPMLKSLSAIAAANRVIEDAPFAGEQFSAHLMNLLTPRPSQISQAFKRLYDAQGPRAATDWFYALCRASDYIRVDQIAKNMAFAAKSAYGELEITINLSKPEKDPKEIAKLKDAPQVGYPSCMLCLENEGYAGRPGYPSHETLRTIAVTLCGESWRMQYSPYAYYPEHMIALNEKHIPMRVDRRSIALLLDFVDQYPHYFIGSNADLPIVGGSILNHDHFQGGRHVFPMDKAPAYAAYSKANFPSVKVEAIDWPMTCIRLTAQEKEPLIAMTEQVLTAWRSYDDPSQSVLHATGNTPHNTITPIARRTADGYCLSLVLRNNRTTKEHPLGIFHPHADLHHIKKENIGLIEVMGLFVLPGRLRAELIGLEGYLTGEQPQVMPAADDPLHQHYDWIVSLAKAHGTSLPHAAAERALRDALGAKCTRVLEDSGVFKRTEAGEQALDRFLKSVGILRKDA